MKHRATRKLLVLPASCLRSKQIPETKIRLQVSNISDMFECAYDDVKFACAFHELHVVYDSGLESSLKEYERIRKTRWACIPRNLPTSKKINFCLSKEKLQVLSGKFFRSENYSTKIVLSGYVTGGDGASPCSECINGHISWRNHLESNIEEVDGRLVGHKGETLMTEIMKIVAFANNNDVEMFLLYHMHGFFRRGAQEVWIRNTGEI